MIFNPLHHPIIFSQPLREPQPMSAWYEHIPFGMSLIGMLKPRLLVELGTHGGASYCGFCQAVQALETETRCYAVDTWQGDAQAGHYDDQVFDDLRAHHDPRYGSFSTLLRSTFDEALPNFADGSIDLLHIDGFHSYEAVQHDFESWLPKLSPRAVVLLHDTNVYYEGFGVHRFWAELKSRYPSFEFLHGHGLGLVAVGVIEPAELHTLLEASEAETNAVRALFGALGYDNKVRHLFATRAREVAEQDATIALLQQQIDNGEGQRRRLSALLSAEQEQRVAENQELVTQLAAITGSRGWRMLQMLWRARRLLRA